MGAQVSKQPGGAPQMMRYCDTTLPASSGPGWRRRAGRAALAYQSPPQPRARLQWKIVSPRPAKFIAIAAASSTLVHFLQTLADTYRFSQCLAAPPGPQQRPRSTGACLALQGSCLARVSSRNTLMRAGADQPEERRDGRPSSANPPAPSLRSHGV